MMDIAIRFEEPEDFPAIKTLVTAAFGRDDTAQFVDAVRHHSRICLAQVAVAAGAIVGHAQWCFAPIFVDERRVDGAYLSCLSVRPDLQRQDIGSRLVRDGLKCLCDRGIEAATLLGDPAFYGRFGFSSELAARIAAPHRSRGLGFQAIELHAGSLDGDRLRGDFPAVIAPTP